MLEQVPLPPECEGMTFTSQLVLFGRKLANGVLNLVRTAQLLVIFLPTIVSSPLLLFEGKSRHIWRLCLVFSLQHAGPAFQKLGQWASTRPDLFGMATREDLEHFHSNVPVEPWALTERTLKGEGLSDAFEEFDKQPLGTGCVAQVHKAKMNGQHVAVKVRRHNVEARITRDMHLLSTVGSIVQTLLPFTRYWGIEEVCQHVSSFLLSQLDLRDEGAHLSEFAKRFESGPCANEVAFPVPLLATKTVLVETFEPGVLLSDLLALDREDEHFRLPNGLRHKLAQAAARSFLEMVIVQNFCHADAHPGNMLVRTIPHFDIHDPTREVEFDKLVWVDAGLVNQLSEHDQVNFVALFTAVAQGDGERAANLMVERSRDPSSVKDNAGFVKGMSEIIDQVSLDSFRLDKIKIGSVLEKVLTLTHRHKVLMEPNFSSLIVSIIVLEGVGRQLDPTLDIFKTSLPMILRAEEQYKKAALSAAYESVVKRSSRRNSRPT